MQPAPLPLDEKCRVERVRVSGLLDTPAEERFDRIARLAARVSGCPIACISLVDERREWFKAVVGWGHPQIARNASFGSHVVAAGERVIIEDLRSDRRFADHPFVLQEPSLGAYAGIPLAADDGSVVGVLAVMDTRPRRSGELDLESLGDLAAIAASEMGVNRFSRSQLELAGAPRSQEVLRIDPLTRLWNRSALLEILDRELLHASDPGQPLSALAIDVDRLRWINDRHGHETGDRVLSDIARTLRASVRPYDSVARIGGEEFAVLMPGATTEVAMAVADRIRISIARTSIEGVTVTIGAASSPPVAATPETLLEAADRALARAKRAGGDAVATVS